MQSRLDIFEYHRPDRWLRSNTEFLILAGFDGPEPFLVLGIGAKSRGDETAAPDDLAAAHVIVGTRVGDESSRGIAAYVLNRHLPADLELPAFFRSGQFFPTDGTAEVSLVSGLPDLSVLGRHAHARGEDDQPLMLTEHGMRCRIHIEGRVTDLRWALSWRFEGTRLPWSLERAVAT
jgi:hypothetical protein